MIHTNLIGRQAKHAIVNFGNFAQAGFECLPGLILDTAILDKGGEVRLAISTGGPTKSVHIMREFIIARWLERVPQPLFNFGFEHVSSPYRQSTMEVNTGV